MCLLFLCVNEWSAWVWAHCGCTVPCSLHTCRGPEPDVGYLPEPFLFCFFVLKMEPRVSHKLDPAPPSLCLSWNRNYTHFDAVPSANQTSLPFHFYLLSFSLITSAHHLQVCWPFLYVADLFQPSVGPTQELSWVQDWVATLDIAHWFPDLLRTVNPACFIGLSLQQDSESREVVMSSVYESDSKWDM